MFFVTWWQGLLFGLFTTVLMLMVGYVFAGMWERYEDKPKAVAGSDPHGH